MAKQNRSSQVKREREQKKRERQRKKAEKAELKRQRKFGQAGDDTGPSYVVVDHLTGEDLDRAEAKDDADSSPD